MRVKRLEREAPLEHRQLAPLDLGQGQRPSQWDGGKRRSEPYEDTPTRSAP